MFNLNKSFLLIKKIKDMSNEDALFWNLISLKHNMIKYAKRPSDCLLPEKVIIKLQ